MEILHRNFEYFLKVAEGGSLQQAALELGVTQPALTLAMKRLEAEIKKPLFERQGKSLRLTLVGKRLQSSLAAQRKTLERHLEEALNGASEPRSLTLGAVGHFGTRWLIPVAEKHESELPLCRFYTGFSFIVHQGVTRGKIDFGYVTWTHPPEGVESEWIKDDPYVIIGLKSKFPQLARAKSLKDLEDLPFIHLPKIQKDVTSFLPRNRKAFVVTSYENYKEILFSGRAIGPAQIDFFSENEKKQLAIAPFPPQYKGGKIYLIWRKDIDAEVKKDMEFLNSKIKTEIRKGKCSLLTNFRTGLS